MDRFETAFRAAVHFTGYATAWAALVLLGVSLTIAFASGLACKADQSTALCIYMDESIKTVAKRHHGQ